MLDANPIMLIWSETVREGRPPGVALDAVTDAVRSSRVSVEDIAVANDFLDAAVAPGRWYAEGPRLLLAQLLFAASFEHPQAESGIRFRTAMALRAAIPADATVFVKEKWAATEAALAEAPPDLPTYGRAELLADVGLILSHSGLFREGRAHFEEAESLYRELSRDGADVHLAALATVLNNLSLVLRGLGKNGEAAVKSDEAVAIYGSLAEKDPGTFRLRFVSATLNLANALFALGCYTSASNGYEACLKAYEGLSGSESMAARPDRAGCLANYGVLLSRLGDWYHAQVALERSVALWREQAQGVTWALLRQLAGSLHNLASVLLHFGNVDEAWQSYDEALRIYLALAQVEPSALAYSNDVAMTRMNMSSCLRARQRHLEAASLNHAALHTYRFTSCRGASVSGDDEAYALYNISCNMRDLGLTKAAHAALRLAFARSGYSIPLRHVLMANLAQLEYEMGNTGLAFSLARSAIDAAESAAEYPSEARGRHGVKGQIENAYRIALCDPAVSSDPERAGALVEALRDREALSGSKGAGGGKERPSADIDMIADGIYLTIQRTQDGVLLLAESRRGVVVAPSSSALLDAGSHLLATVTDAEDGSGSDRAIARAGHDLWRSLPHSIQELIWQSRDTEIVLSADQETGQIPFELMTETGESEHSLCLVNTVSRCPGKRLLSLCRRRQAIDRTGVPRAVIFADPTPRHPTTGVTAASFLPESEREAQAIAGVLARHGFQSAGGDTLLVTRDRATSGRFMEGLAADPSIIHFAGHGITAAEAEWLVFAEPRGLHPLALWFRARPLSRSPLVFLDACVAGRARAFGGAFRGFPITFIELGASAVVASPFMLRDRAAAGFAREFYDGLLSGQTVGQAMTGARQRIAARSSSEHWGRVLLYGNAQARLSSP